MHVCESANAHLLVPHELDGNRCEAITNTANEFALRDLYFHSLIGAVREPVLPRQAHLPTKPRVQITTKGGWSYPQTRGFQIVDHL